MRRPRLATAVCLLLGALALALPAGALAGGSAGNQQYTDPFGSSTTPSHQATTQTATQTATATTPPAPTATTPPTSPASGGSTGSSAPGPSTATDPTPASPPATAVTGPTTGTLPYTGYAVWLAAGFGVTLLTAGLMLRRRTREGR